MHQLTREQKIENYKEILTSLEAKKLNLEKQIIGIKAKIDKQEELLIVEEANTED